MNVYPFKFKPIFKERIWGGQKLRTFFEKDLPPNTKIGESWELADMPEDKTEILNGPLAGRPLAYALEKFGPAITGKEHYEPPFPLQTRFIDAQDILSVQVHPGPETCRRTRKGDPKTECWYIIDGVPGAFLYKGFRRGVTKADFIAALKRGTVADLIHKVPVCAGECHLIPAGTVHAIGPGLLIAEVQTPSDTTYRVFDWNRLDASGQQRTLHLEDALESINFGICGEELHATSKGPLVDCEYFKLDKCFQSAGSKLSFAAGEMRVLMILAGSGRLTSGAIETVHFKKGDTLLVPAALSGNIEFAETCEYLSVSEPR